MYRRQACAIQVSLEVQHALKWLHVLQASAAAMTFKKQCFCLQGAAAAACTCRCPATVQGD